MPCFNRRLLRPWLQLVRRKIFNTIEERIQDLKKERNAVILSHNYQDNEIQQLADFVGDSLELAKKCQGIASDTIVFCGVHFMAETAKLLNPEKTVLLPDLEAGCSLADGCKPSHVFTYKHMLAKKRGVEPYLIAYINCSAEVKSLVDICCTSANALDIVNSAPKDRPILFLPDYHLGSWLQKQTDREIILWNGSCSVHESLSRRDLIFLKQQHPNAITIVHPECMEGIIDLADEVLSTSGMVARVKQDTFQEFIVGTEANMIHRLRRENPTNIYIAAPGMPAPGEASCGNCMRCPHMALNTLEKLEKCLKFGFPTVTIDPKVEAKARQSIESMLTGGANGRPTTGN